MKMFLFHCVVAAALSTLAAQERYLAPLVLPGMIFAVPGETLTVVFRNTALISPGESFVVSEIECSVGEISASKESWTFTPEDNQTGDFSFILKSGSNQAATTVRVVPREAGKGRNISLLIVGDSLTNASVYSNEIARILTKPGNPNWQMLGSHRPKSGAEDVRNEGYGGWTWKRFNTRWEPSAPQIGKTRSSPFLYLDGDTPHLNFDRYFSKYSSGNPPDFATFLLGVNDCFHADPDNLDAVESKIDAMFAEADKFLSAFRLSAPNAQIGICLTPPANDRDEAFVANYKDRYSRWGWRRIQFRLVQRQLEHFGNRESENIYIVPTSVGIDPFNGYPHDNGVHPNASGYKTIGNEIYAWLKWRLSCSS